MTLSIEDVKVGAIYPPYQTDDFQSCPKRWDLGKRWQPKEDPYARAKLIGKAVAAGLEVYFTGLKKGLADIKTMALEAGAALVQREYEEDAEYTLKGTLELTRRGIRHGMETDLGIETILGVERSYGRIRPDLVVRLRGGALAPIDHKVKVHLDEKYKEKELTKFNTSNQVFHYAWQVGQEYGEPVEVVYIHLIVLAPRVYTEVHRVAIDPEHLAYWLQGVAYDWNLMKWTEANPSARAVPRFHACNDGTFPCPMQDACHLFRGDETKIATLYDPRRWS